MIIGLEPKNMAEVVVKESQETYTKWDIPIHSDVPMGFKPTNSHITLE